MALERRLDAVLERIVATLAEQPGVALARVWLVEPDVSSEGLAEPGVSRAGGSGSGRLRLVASAGGSLAGEAWTRIDGRFARVPLGTGKIGKVGAAGTGMLLHDMSERSSWIADAGWAAREELRSFAAQPLAVRGEIHGVLAAFSRARVDADAFAWLRAFADFAAVAIVNARAFERVERVRAQLELENACLRAADRSGRGADAAAPGSRLRQLTATVVADGARAAASPALVDTAAGDVIPIVDWRRRERANVEAALARSGGRIYGSGGAAELLGVPPTTLVSRAKALGIERRRR